jgi:hypothetical protein
MKRRRRFRDSHQPSGWSYITYHLDVARNKKEEREKTIGLTQVMTNDGDFFFFFSFSNRKYQEEEQCQSSPPFTRMGDIHLRFSIGFSSDGI